MFRKWINNQLNKNNMTQRQLAKKLEVHESLISRWTAGHRKPSIDKIVKLCDIFETPIHVLTAVVLNNEAVKC